MVCTSILNSWFYFTQKLSCFVVLRATIAKDSFPGSPSDVWVKNRITAPLVLPVAKGRSRTPQQDNWARQLVRSKQRGRQSVHLNYQVNDLKFVIIFSDLALQLSKFRLVQRKITSMC